MRVIAGTKRGHKLNAVPGSSTRPTTDRVKEAIFNMIGPFFTGGCGLDLFAGTGGLGIEALSRGLERVVFIERDRKALEVIHKNLAAVHFSEQAGVYRGDALKLLYVLAQREAPFDVIFLDPPYVQKKLPLLLAQIGRHHLLSDTGVVVVEYPREQDVPEAVGPLCLLRLKTYGNICIALFGLAKQTEQSEAGERSGADVGAE